MIPQPNQVWQERRRPKADPWVGERRRVVQVTSADEHGFVEGIGRRQREVGDGWVDETWPGVRRKTRVRTTGFLRRYELVHEAAAAPE